MRRDTGRSGSPKRGMTTAVSRPNVARIEWSLCIGMEQRQMDGMRVVGVQVFVHGVTRLNNALACVHSTPLGPRRRTGRVLHAMGCGVYGAARRIRRLAVEGLRTDPCPAHGLRPGAGADCRAR